MRLNTLASAFVAAIIGGFIVISFAGHWEVDMFVQRDNGAHIPEMRLPAFIVSLISDPQACVLYGAGFGLHLHWMSPVVAIRLNMSKLPFNRFSLT